VDLDAGVDQHALVDAIQPRDLAVLVRQEGFPIKRLITASPPIGTRDFEVLAKMRGVGKQLLRDAADVDAGAAEAARLGDRDLCSVPGRDAARADPARAAAYREEIVVETQLTSGWEG
jgi:hypothetical protein